MTFTKIYNAAHLREAARERMKYPKDVTLCYNPASMNEKFRFVNNNNNNENDDTPYRWAKPC